MEITDINRVYLEEGKLRVELMGRGYAWLDMGTHDSLLDASMFVKAIEERQGLRISCVEEIAYRMGYIDKKQLTKHVNNYKNEYGEYLSKLLTQ